jgi:hypothetical protein
VVNSAILSVSELNVMGMGRSKAKNNSVQSVVKQANPDMMVVIETMYAKGEKDRYVS